jgi:hypothetical protein
MFVVNPCVGVTVVDYITVWEHLEDLERLHIVAVEMVEI